VAALAALIAITAMSCDAEAAAVQSARATSRSRALHVTVTLRPRDPARLAAYAQAVSTPGSPEYGDYLTPHQFGARFGASAVQIAAVRTALRAAGLDPGRASAGGLSIRFTATAPALRRAHVAAGGLSRRARTAVSPATAPDTVTSVVGLGDSDAAQPLAVRSARRPARPLAGSLPSTSTPSGPQACVTAAGDAPAQGAYTDNEIAGGYGFDPLYDAGDEGAGTTVAVYELEPDDPTDIAAFQSCYATHADISYVRVDGGAGVGAGSDEAAFDIENLIGFAPAAHLLVYQAPNSSSGLPGSGPYDLYSAIINQDRAQVVSVSWGQCEAQLGVRAARAESTLFEQAAVQGQTIVAAAGDNGAEDCDTGGTRSSTALAVDDPAAQPFVTGVGGTTLQSLGPPPTERAWNSGAGAGTGTSSVGAGGGGVSSLWSMPIYQLDAPARLGVVGSADQGSLCGHAEGDCREVPDVSADADPATGYEIYWNGEDTEPEPSGWQALGGTSGAAPLWAALFTLADASPACHGSAIGDAGPALYRAAAEHYAADFHDVTAGDTDDAATHGGDWPAGRGYDLATGLGTPDAGLLVGDLCASSPRLTAPAPQISADRAAVGVSLHAAGRLGSGLIYTAAQLPPGIQLDAATGRLSGRPRTPGRYHVRAGVQTADGARAATRFDWNVGGSPRITVARLQDDRLQIDVRCAAHVPWLRRLRIHLPAGLRVGVRSRIRAPAGTRLRLRGQVLTVSLRAPAGRLEISVPVHRSGARAIPPVSIGVRSGNDGTSTLTSMISPGHA
jgi:hypothetical protein